MTTGPGWRKLAGAFFYAAALAMYQALVML